MNETVQTGAAMVACTIAGLFFGWLKDRDKLRYDAKFAALETAGEQRKVENLIQAAQIKTLTGQNVEQGEQIETLTTQHAECKEDHAETHAKLDACEQKHDTNEARLNDLSAAVLKMAQGGSGPHTPI